MDATAVTTMNLDEIVSTIQAMQMQERGAYTVTDYLHQQSPTSGPVTKAWSAPIDERCRAQMVAWCYQLVDFFEFKRETAASAISCLDRYLGTTAGCKAQMNRKEFQLATVSALYIAVKIHESKALDPTVISSFSRGTLTPRQVERMERSILNAIQWRVHPPTIQAFLRFLLALIPTSLLSGENRMTVLEWSMYKAEVTVSDYIFAMRKPSEIAAVMLIDSLQNNFSKDRDSALKYFGFALARHTGIHRYSKEFLAVQTEWTNVMSNQFDDRNSDSLCCPHETSGSTTKDDTKRLDPKNSPRSVSLRICP